jgi:hypothetical protein
MEVVFGPLVVSVLHFFSAHFFLSLVLIDDILNHYDEQL